MKIEHEIDDKAFIKELCNHYISWAYDDCRRLTESKQWYGDFAEYVKAEIHKLVEDNKEMLLEKIIERAADMTRKSLSSVAIACMQKTPHPFDD